MSVHIRAQIFRAWATLAMGVGRTRSRRPLSNDWGRGRGTPIDRHYIEGFIENYATDIRGRVLEIGDDNYSRRFGGQRITIQDILHLTGDSRATIVGDLCQPNVLPKQAFDCIILTQTLQFLDDLPVAIDHLHGALRSGGVLLVTTPGITPVGQGEWGPYWSWSLTQVALKRLLSRHFDPGNVTLRTYGNLAAATAFLHAAVVEETGIRRLMPLDLRYPVIVAARAVA